MTGTVADYVQHEISGKVLSPASIDEAVFNESCHGISVNIKAPTGTVFPTVSQQTRHARRIYVGGIPVGFADEELVKSFLNSVISKGLGEENDNSYVLSVYINQKKCFTFVEFKSIELTTACLELDGLIYHSSVLKVLRANEYKPELLPPSPNPAIKLHLPASAFGTPIAGGHQQVRES
jgi:RNA recognition motif-containing protein